MGCCVTTERVTVKYFSVDPFIDLFRDLLVISRKVGALFVLKNSKDFFAGIPSRICRYSEPRWLLLATLCVPSSSLSRSILIGSEGSPVA